MSPNTVIKKNLWKYYIKSDIKRLDFKAQCRFCENKCEHLKFTNFEKHISLHHRKIWKYEKEKKLTQRSRMYFKYLNKFYSQCIICDKNVLSISDALKNHLNSHSEEQRKNYVLCGWSRKYCTKRDNFVVECDICHNNLSLSITSHLSRHIKKKHSDKLKNAEERHDTAGSLEHVLLFETDPLFTSLKDCYIDMIDFWIHIKEMHKKVFNLEEKFRSLHGWSRTYYKYFNSLALKCIICEKNVLFLSESLEDHLRSHSEEQLKKHTSHSWLWKYCTKRDDVIVNCNLCHNDFFIFI